MLKPRVRLLVGAPIAAVVAAVAFAAWRSWDSGTAGPAVPRGAFATAWTQRPVMFVGIGDSITRGFGARPGYSYFARLVVNPADEFPEMSALCLSRVFPRIDVRNVSENGTTSDEHVAQIASLPRADAETLGVLVMTTGGNDLIHNYGRSTPRECAMYGATMEQARPWIEAFEKRLDGMLKAVEERFAGGCHVFLGTIYDPTDGRGDIEAAGFPAWPDGLVILAAYNGVIRRVASRHASTHVVDLHGLFLGHGIRERGERRWYHGNVEDPNERGYDAIRRLMLAEMAKVLGPSVPSK